VGKLIKTRSSEYAVNLKIKTDHFIDNNVMTPLFFPDGYHAGISDEGADICASRKHRGISCQLMALEKPTWLAFIVKPHLR
jgi:hypothetical protein